MVGTGVMPPGPVTTFWTLVRSPPFVASGYETSSQEFVKLTYKNYPSSLQTGFCISILISLYNLLIITNFKILSILDAI